MPSSVWVFFCFFFIGGVLSQVSPPVTPTITISISPTITMSISPTITMSISPTITNSVSITMSVSPSITMSVSPTITNSWSLSPSITNTWTPSPSITNTWTQSPSITNSWSPSVSTTITNSFTFSNSQSGSYSISVSNSISISPSITPMMSISPQPIIQPIVYSQPFNFKTDNRRLRINNIQCGYYNPNVYCKWIPGKIGYKRVRLEVDCNANGITFGLNTQPVLSLRSVSNTSTPRYNRGTAPGSQQLTLVSLDLPPNVNCKLVLTCRMYSNKVNKKKLGGVNPNDTGVAYTISRFWFSSKFGPGDTFVTGPHISR